MMLHLAILDHGHHHLFVGSSDQAMCHVIRAMLIEKHSLFNI